METIVVGAHVHGWYTHTHTVFTFVALAPHRTNTCVLLSELFHSCDTPLRNMLVIYGRYTRCARNWKHSGARSAWSFGVLTPRANRASWCLHERRCTHLSDKVLASRAYAVHGIRKACMHLPVYVGPIDMGSLSCRSSRSQCRTRPRGAVRRLWTCHRALLGRWP